MTAYNYFYLIAIGLVVIGWGARAYAEGDVTIVSAPPSTNAAPQTLLAPDGTPIVHKSLHRKKGSSTATAGTKPVTSPSSTAVSMPGATAPPSPSASGAKAATPAPAVVTTVTPSAPLVPDVSVGPPPAPVAGSRTPEVGSSLPTVETGLPVARHTTNSGTAALFEPSSVPKNTTLPGSANSALHKTSLTNAPKPYQASLVGAIPGLSSSPSVSPMGGAVSTVVLPEHRSTHTYPWKTNIITTMFWIGEAGSSISPTDNEGSAWIEDWRAANGGGDSPYDHRGYLPAGHAATVNPFYVALPFNDLAYPDKAREWVPSSWHRPNKDGKQVSACQHRWVEIKNEQGDRCFAQWEDVGPLRTDHAEYVFGSERPNTLTRAGLDVSPAVGKCLGISEDGKAITRWHFVDDEDVPPGPWLKYDEQAVIFAAMKELKDSNPSKLPIQRATTPIEDKSNLDSNKKKVGAAKG
jgi:hypothetical protein